MSYPLHFDIIAGELNMPACYVSSVLTNTEQHVINEAPQ